MAETTFEGRQSGDQGELRIMLVAVKDKHTSDTEMMIRCVPCFCKICRLCMSHMLCYVTA